MPAKQRTASPTTPHEYEHLLELAEILAAGLVRLRCRQSTSLSGLEANVFLDCVGQASGDADHPFSGGPQG